MTTVIADATPLLETKLFSPRPPRSVVARPRLTERLDRAAESKLTLVSAPAGFGKTTLLAEWLAAAPDGDRSRAWLSLDRGDNEPASFWTYVIAALQTAGAGARGSARSRSCRRPQPPPIEAVLATLLNELSAVPDDVVLVLDDYHVVDAPEVHDGMAFLLDHLPPQIAPGDRQPRRSGAAAGPPARARRARRDPRRRPALHARRGRRVPQRGDGLGAHGGGCRSAGGRAPKAGSPRSSWRRSRCRGETTSPASSPASPATTATSSTTWSRRSCSASPSAVRSFLLQTSILDRLSGPLCDAVTGQDGGKAMLEALDRGNLFVVPLDDRRQWYRYHHLFADVLRARLADEQPDRVPQLHRRASDVVRAERRAVRGDPPRAGRRGLRSARRTWSSWPCRACAGVDRRPTLLGWLRALPDELVRAGPCSATRTPGCCWPAASSRASSPPAGRRAVARRRRPRARWTGAGPPGWSSWTRRSSAASRRRSPCTVPATPWRGRRGRDRAHTPGGRSTSPRRTTISGAERRPALLGLAVLGERGPRGGAPSRMPTAWRACSGRGTSRTPSAARSPWRTSGSRRVVSREAMRTYEQALQLATEQGGPVLRGDGGHARRHERAPPRAGRPARPPRSTC